MRKIADEGTSPWAGHAGPDTGIGGSAGNITFSARYARVRAETPASNVDEKRADGQRRACPRQVTRCRSGAMVRTEREAASLIASSNDGYAGTGRS
jgi:hypothetical protein